MNKCGKNSERPNTIISQN